MKIFLAKFIQVSLTLLFLPAVAQAHVKWFTRSRDTSVIQFADLNTPAFWFLFVLSVLTIALLIYADRALEKLKFFIRFNNYLESYTDRATIVLRVFTGAALLLSWQSDSMIAPELKVTNGLVGWYQFFLALALLTSQTTPLAGLGMIGLYFYAITQHGFFHMLDYVVYLSIGYFLFVAAFKNQQIAQSRIPALYMGLGFSLCWAALEKLFFPSWGLDVLRQQPELTMRLPHDFFLMASAFIELSLGYLLIIGVLQRPLALTITIVFFITSAFFGKVEVIGHTMLHGALLVFAIIGPGRYYPAPIQFHDRLILKSLFAAVNFVVIIGLMGYAYHSMAAR